MIMKALLALVFYFAHSVLSFEINDSTCDLRGFDTKNLTRVPWKIDSTVCFGNDTKCALYFSICYNIKEYTTWDCAPNDACEKTSQITSLGKFQRIFQSSKKGFTIEYSRGKNSTDATCNFTTQLNFQCNREKPLIITDAAALGKLVSRSVKKDLCALTIDIEYSGACLTETATSEGMSTGSILILLFFIGLLLYLIGGVIYNHSNGARGLEMLPNLSFWRELPGLVVDGVVLFCQFITCRLSEGRTYDAL